MARVTLHVITSDVIETIPRLAKSGPDIGRYRSFKTKDRHMPHFPIHSLDTAPEAAKPALNGLKLAFGFVPNIAGAMATSPVLISCLAALFERVHSGSFSEKEIQTLLLTNAVANGSEWPVAFHSYLALQQGVSADSVKSIRDGGLPADPHLAALSRLAQVLIHKRGLIDDGDVRAFISAGFDESTALEVIAVSAASTITNYTASVTHPPLEVPFDAHAWTARKSGAA